MTIPAIAAGGRVEIRFPVSSLVCLLLRQDQTLSCRSAIALFVGTTALAESGTLMRQDQGVKLSFRIL